MSEPSRAAGRRFRPSGELKRTRSRRAQAAPPPPRPARTTDARRAAYEALAAFDRRHVFVSHVLEESFAGHTLPTADRALAVEITAGVVRRTLTLDAILAPHIRRPRELIEPGLWTLLRIGVYQLVFLNTPPHAAVHETVELARRLQKPRWVRFANAVLRSVQRDLTEELLSEPATDAVPVLQSASGAALEWQYRRLRRPYFPDPAIDYPGYVSQACSMPRWLVDRWVTQRGAVETLRLCQWFLSPGRICLRVNSLRADRERVLEVLRTAGVAAGPGALPEAIHLAQTVNVVNLPGFAEGWFSVQDESAMHAAVLLDPQPGERVLDLCAAPGGKTTHLAERMRNEGQIIAVDVHVERLGLVDAACQRLGLSIIESRTVQADNSDLPPGPFDRILVDVPCSNTGVLGKRPEARWRITADGISELAALQRRLLTAAAARLAPGGRMVYSTCSIEPEENEQVVQGVLESSPELRLQTEQKFRPGLPGDGAYQALLVRAP